MYYCYIGIYTIFDTIHGNGNCYDGATGSVDELPFSKFTEAWNPIARKTVSMVPALLDLLFALSFPKPNLNPLSTTANKDSEGKKLLLFWKKYWRKGCRIPRAWKGPP